MSATVGLEQAGAIWLGGGGGTWRVTGGSGEIAVGGQEFTES